jgi:hypothetical protein
VPYTEEQLTVMRVLSAEEYRWKLSRKREIKLESGGVS